MREHPEQHKDSQWLTPKEVPPTGWFKWAQHKTYCYYQQQDGKTPKTAEDFGKFSPAERAHLCKVGLRDINNNPQPEFVKKHSEATISSSYQGWQNRRGRQRRATPSMRGIPP